MTYKNNKIGVSVPAYNEENLIGKTLAGIPDYVDRIYVCDDSSIDRTSEIVENLMKDDKRIFLIRHEKNMGVGGAIVDCHKKALEANMDIVAVMAGDNQMDATQLFKLLDPIIDNKTDYAKGNRLYERDALKGMSMWRTFGNVILTFMTKVSSGYWHISDPQNGYTAINKKALQKLNLDGIYQGYLFENDMLTKLNVCDLRVMDISIPARYGEEQSKIKYSSFIVKGLWALTCNFFWRMKIKYIIHNFHPLVLFYFFGILTIFVGLFTTIWSIYTKLFAQQLIFERLILSWIVIGMGVQFILFAMYFDMINNRRTMEQSS